MYKICRYPSGGGKATTIYNIKWLWLVRLIFMCMSPPRQKVWSRTLEWFVRKEDIAILGPSTSEGVRWDCLASK